MIRMRPGRQEEGLLNYEPHFALLACIAAVLGVTSRWQPPLGAVASCGIYGALHASVVAVTLRAPAATGRKLSLVAGGALLSMLSVTLSLYASRIDVTLPGMVKPALLLTLTSGFGSASYLVLLRYLVGANLGPASSASISLGCVLATLGVLASGAYRHGGVLSFAIVWWFVFSFGLWTRDRKSRRAA